MFQVTDLLDLVLVATLLFAGIVWLRRSRARFAFVGVAIAGVVYLAARRLGLELTAWILQGFFAVFVIIVVVVFQEDLRRLFEQIAIWGLRRRPPLPPSTAVDTLVRTLSRLASSRVGALLVIPGREPLDRLLEGGEHLDAWVSESLLLSLFDTSSPGHDGAVVLDEDRAVRFAVHLPLSTDRDQLGTRGTRHAAALGLAERCDALCVVVSEESGRISIALDGQLRQLTGPDVLADELRLFLKRLTPGPVEIGRWKTWRRRLPETATALALTAALWFLLVPGGNTIEVDHLVPVVVVNLPEGFVLESIDPEEVKVTFSGMRRLLVLEDLDTARVRVDALLVKLGRRTFQLSKERVEHPESLRVVGLSPSRVRISVLQEHEAPPLAADRTSP